MGETVPDAAVHAALKVAAGLGVTSQDPVVLADGANVVVHLRPSPVVAKVAGATTAVRPDTGAWLQRELDVVQFLAAAGLRVMTPSPEMSATTYDGDGHVMSFWRYLRSAGGALPTEALIGSMLRDLHAALRSYPGAMPRLAPLRDIPAFLARPQTRQRTRPETRQRTGPETRPQTRLSAGQAAALSAAYTRLTAELDPAAAGQILHGDAGAGNLMNTDTGWVWHDFEDTCSGPVAWDLAASTASQRLDGPSVLAAYGEPVDAGELRACEQLRRLHLTVWYSLYAERMPEHRARAAELLAMWPEP